MKYIWLIILLTIMASFMRVYRIMDYPIQLGHDEITQLYDAVSVAQTGRDIYGNFMPTIFSSVHDFKPPFYTYATVLFYYLFGDQEWIIKIPGLLFSILMIPVIYFFSTRIFKNQMIGIWSAFITTSSSFEIFYGRKSFENGAGIFCVLLGFGFLYKYLEDSQLKWVYLGVGVLGLGMYTYFSHAVIIPLILLSWLVINNRLFQLNWKKLIWPLLFWLVIITPLIYLIAFNPDSRYRSQTVFVTQDPNLGQQLVKTDNQLLKLKTIADYSFKRYLNQFNPEYLFLNGLDLTNQGPIGVGPLLLIQLPLILIGVYWLVKNKNLGKQKWFILTWMLIGMIPSGVTFEEYSPHRSIMVFTMFNILTGVGMYALLGRCKNWRMEARILSISIIGLIFILNFTYFVYVYTAAFPKEKSQEIHYPFKEVALYAAEEKINFNQVVFDPKFGEISPRIGTAAHYYLGYYGKVTPADFQKDYHLGDLDKREVLFDKYSIRAINWASDSRLKNVLLIASPWVLDKNGIDQKNLVKIFHFADGVVAFYVVKL